MYKGKHIRHRRRWIIGTWALIILAAAIVLMPFIEPYRLEVEAVELTDVQLPEATQSLRVVFASDFARSGWPFLTDGRAASVIGEINRQNADIVLFGGDYAAVPEDTVAFFESLPSVRWSLGCYAVLGEKDRYVPLTDAQKRAALERRDPEGRCTDEMRAAILAEEEEAFNRQRIEQLRDVMHAKGITLLINECESVRYGDGTVTVAGLDDPILGHADFAATAGRVASNDYVILLAHNPSLIEDAIKAASASGAQDWFDLAFFGHTMGNQFFGSFNPLGIATDVTTASHRKGWIREAHDTPMLISRGVGTVGLPVRLGCRPQIHVTDIRRGP